MLRDDVLESMGTGSAIKGALFDPSTNEVTFGVFSERASRLEVWLYGSPRGSEELLRIKLTRGTGGIWSGKLSLSSYQNAFSDVIYYGYRAWGPNWSFDQNWSKGKGDGFMCDVDAAGNRFNPNKLLLDPYAREISHDPAPRLSHIDPNEVAPEFYSGSQHRLTDTGSIAPKGVLVLRQQAAGAAQAPSRSRPQRSLKDDVVCELHVRGFTMLDQTLEPPIRGTYKGAARKAQHLRRLGVTAVELLPVFQFANEQNDDGDRRGDNYWGYMTLGYFAPNRRYSSDKSPGGAAREFREMVESLHAEGIKVILDVVYNHTAEGLLYRDNEDGSSRRDDAHQDPSRAALLSFRGLDNATYYALRAGGQRYQDYSDCGPSLNMSMPVVRDFILDSLRFWANEMGVDGFRFDLAPVLANTCASESFQFDWSAPDCVLQRMGRELPLRSESTPAGVDLIAEPWAASGGYYLGRFPDGWAEWNDVYRNTLGNAENRLGIRNVSPYKVADVIAGSDQEFKPSRNRARPWNSINYWASHDGLTLHDLFAYTNEDRNGWDHGGDQASQRQAVRNAFALLATSVGAPMFMAGDEILRSQGGEGNAVAIDAPSVYVNWDDVAAYEEAVRTQDRNRLATLRELPHIRTLEFATHVLGLRQRYQALRRDDYFTGSYSSSGLRDMTWYSSSGQEGIDPGRFFIGYRIDTSSNRSQNAPARSIYVAYNWDSSFVELTLPGNLKGALWHRIVDTARWMEPQCNIDRDETIISRSYGMHGRTVAIFCEF